MADAVVHVFSRIPLAAEYYQRCGLDVFGPSRLTTGQTIQFSSFEELLDNILIRTELMQIIVSHGSPVNGLIMQFARGGGQTATGNMIQDLSALADAVGGATPVTKEDPRVIDAASRMVILPEIVIRIAEKIRQIRNRKLIFLIRGCNIGANQPMLRDYKKAFQALAIFAPTCRMFFLRIRPHPPSRRLGQTMANLALGSPATPRTRRRNFPQPNNSAFSSSLIIDVRDIDGHTRVDNEAFIGTPDANNAWAREFNGAWNGGMPNEFIIPVMWDNDEATYHVPPEIGYRQKFVVV